MKVKGITFITRKQGIINKFGENRWEEFIKNFSKEDSYFADNLILASTWIPAEHFLKFNDAVNNEFYGGDNSILWELGKDAADFALKEDGPYEVFVKNKDIKTFTDNYVSMIWNSHFSDGYMSAKFDGIKVDIIVSGLPLVHDYFEFLVMGYSKRAYEVVSGKNVKLNKIFDQDPNSAYHYEVIFL